MIRYIISRYHQWRSARAYRNAVRFFDRMKADARRLHAPTKYIERAQQEWLHRALRGGDVA